MKHVTVEAGRLLPEAARPALRGIGAHSHDTTRSGDFDFRNATKADLDRNGRIPPLLTHFHASPVSHFSDLGRLAPSVSVMRTAPSDASRRTRSSLKRPKQVNGNGRQRQTKGNHNQVIDDRILHSITLPLHLFGWTVSIMTRLEMPAESISMRARDVW
jgi:hypothetical protein